MQTFGQFRLDATNQCLWRENTRISLAPKAFAVLRYLVDHPGRLVTQDELLTAVWADTFVQPEVLRKYILELRKVLGDQPKKPIYIETFPKRGYQFVATVTRSAHAPGPTAPVAVQAVEPPPPTFVGRDTVLAELEGCLGKTLAGQRQFICVTGEAGIGKSTVVDAFQQSAARYPDLRQARGQCVEGFGGKETYYPLLDALGQLVRGPRSAEVIDVLAAQAPTWLIQFPAVLKTEQREELQRQILGATRERMVREICEALEILTENSPLVLVLEDMHWVDHSTLDVVSALARRRGSAKLLVLLTFRPLELILLNNPLKGLKQELVVHRLCREFNLERLNESNVAEYLRAEAHGEALPEGLASLIHNHSDGNPLFMTAIVGELIESGAITHGDHGWRLTKPLGEIHLGVPETLQQMLELQVDQLSDRERQVLRSASVAGRRFSAWSVAAMLDIDVPSAEETCENFARRQQLLRSGRGGTILGAENSGQYEFRHALYREALYRRIPAAQRSNFHANLARQAESLYERDASAFASEIALHFENGRDGERAARYLLLSAQNAARKYAHRDAIATLRHALDLLSAANTESARSLELDVLEKMSDAHYALGEMEESAEVDGHAATLAAERRWKVQQVAALTRAARALSFLDPDECVTVCESAAEVSSTIDDPLLAARTALLAACWRIVNNGWSRRDADICAASRAKIRELQGAGLPAYYEVLYAHVQALSGEYVDSLAIADAGLAKARETQSLVVYLSSLSSKSLALIHLGRWGELRRALEHGIELAEKNGNEPWAGIFRSMLAWLHMQSCDFDEARRLAQEILVTNAEEPIGQAQCLALLTAAYADLATGRPQAALLLLTRVRDRQPKPKVFLQWYWRMISEFGIVGALLESGDLEKAESAAEQFRKETESTADPALRSPAWETLARVAAARGDISKALACAERAIDEMKGCDLPSVAWRVHSMASWLNARAGNLEEARDHQKKARKVLLMVANSYDSHEPLRESLEAAAHALNAKLEEEMAGAPSGRS
ncbi:MAG: AAA family ATPase [Bryobacteraceae bacterium]